MRRLLTLLLLVVAASLLVGATGSERVAPSGVEATLVTAAPDALNVTHVTAPAPPGETTPASEAAAQAIELDVYSINGGGSQEVQAGDLRLGLSVAQPVAGVTSAGAMRLELGYWYMVAEAACPVTLAGDVNLSGEIVLSDVIYMANYVLKAGPDPQPCAASGDVNCTGEISLADVIYLANYVLKGGPLPCDVCTMIPATWTCP
jgi:hypothetical protein